jgi:PhnB protein
MSAPNPKSHHYHSVTPYLIVKDAASAIDFYTANFDGVEMMRLPGPSGRIGHAEIRLGDSTIMLADESLECGARSPETLGGSPVSLLLYVEDVDAVTAKAAASGAQILRPPRNQFYGDRTAMLLDPFGHTWTLATHMEDVAPEEMQRRAEALAAEYEQISSGSAPAA